MLTRFNVCLFTHNIFVTAYLNVFLSIHLSKFLFLPNYIYVCIYRYACCVPVSFHPPICPLSTYIHLSLSVYLYTHQSIFNFAYLPCNDLSLNLPVSISLFHFPSTAPSTWASYSLRLTYHLFAALRVWPHRYLIVRPFQYRPFSQSAHPSVQPHRRDMLSTVLLPVRSSVYLTMPSAPTFVLIGMLIRATCNTSRCWWYLNIPAVLSLSLGSSLVVVLLLSLYIHVNRFSYLLLFLLICLSIIFFVSPRNSNDNQLT